MVHIRYSRGQPYWFTPIGATMRDDLPELVFLILMVLTITALRLHKSTTRCLLLGIFADLFGEKVLGSGLLGVLLGGVAMLIGFFGLF